MKKTGTFKNKVFAGVIAAVCAVSVISTGAIIGASAFSSASSNADTAVIERRTSGSTFTLPMKGVDWNYFSDSLDVTVDCEIDFSRNLCNFKFTAIRPGAANITLQTKSTDGTWSNTPIKITVDSGLHMNIVQNGNTAAANNDIKFTVDEDDTTAIIASKTSNSTFNLPMKGNDWNYYADSLNVKVTGAVDFERNICTFTFKAVKPGIANIDLQTKDTDGTWINTPVRITVDKDLSMNIVQTGTPSVISEKSMPQDNKAVETKTEENNQVETNANKEYWLGEYAGTTRNDAIELVIPNYNDGWTVLIADESVYYGADAWYISVLNEKTGAVKSAYVIGDDCFFVEDSEEETEETNENINNKEYWEQEYADTTLVDAVDLAASYLDDEWYYINSEQTRYQGFAAWAIVFSNTEGENIVLFVNGSDCYF